MPTYYAIQQAGTLDGSQIPANKVDGRVVGAKASGTLATKDHTAINASAPALAANDLVYLGKVRAGELLRSIEYFTDTSFGAVVVQIGTLAAPTKYANAQMTVSGAWTKIAMNASVITAGPLSADEDIYAKVSGAVAAAVIAHWYLETLGVR